MALRARLCSLFIFILAGLPLVASAGAPRYKIIDLGGIHGFTNTTPLAINNTDQIVGRMISGDNQLHAFLLKDGRFTDLGTGSADRIDNRGRILFEYNYESFLWQDSALVPLGELSAEGSEAGAMNDNGDVAGAVVSGGSYKRAYLWRDYQGHLLPLRLPSTNPGGYWITDVAKMNDEDAVIGRAVPPNSDLQYIYLYENGKTTLILPKGASKAWPIAINNRGWVLGEAKILNQEIVYAFIWRDGKVTQIGPVAKDTGTSAIDMNDNGQVLGTVNVMKITNRIDANIYSSSYLWQDGHRYDLLKLIENAAGWTNLELTAMNNRGDIVGTGTYKGQNRVILLKPI